MTVNLHWLVYPLVITGLINLARMTLMRLGSDRFRPNPAAPPAFFPTLTVIIPAHNEQGTILRAVASVLFNGYPLHRLQVIVVDNASTDQTSHLVQTYRRHHPRLPLQLVREPKPGKAHALNAGLLATDSDLVMCLDADSYLRPGALSRLPAAFKDPAVTALAANVHIIPRPGWFNLIQQFEYLVCYQMKRAEYHFNINYIIGGIGSTFRRAAIKQVGYYDTDTVTEDIDLTLKLIDPRGQPGRLTYDPYLIAHTEAVPDLAGLIRQRFRWKWGRYQTFLKNSHLFFASDHRLNPALSYLYLPFALFGDLAFLIEPILLLYLVGWSVYSQDWTTLISAFALITLYHVLTVASEDSLSRRRRFKFILLSPPMYFWLYLISLAEYRALLQSLSRLHHLQPSLTQAQCSWTHVRRALA